MKNVIYALHNGDSVYRYIGLTTIGVEKRFATHTYKANYGIDYPVYRWMRKHGVKNIEYTVLATFEDDEIEALKAEEIAQIALHSASGKLLNSTTGGDGVTNPSLEARAKMSAKSLGRKHTDEVRARISASKKGYANRGVHTRWHESRNIIKSDCTFCKEAA